MILVLLAGWLSLIPPFVLTAEENKDPFLRQSPFSKMVVFYNQAQQKTEARIFDDAELDNEKNVVFQREKQVPLILPANRIQAIVPIAPEDIDQISLIDLRKGLEDCSKATHSNTEISEMVAKWKSLVSKKEKQITAEKHLEEERQSKAIQDAALEKAAEELAVAQKYIDHYDRLAVRQQVEEGLAFINRLNPHLFEKEDQLKKARRHWEAILSLPPQAPIPTEWPFAMPVDQFIKVTSEADQLPTKTAVMAVLFGLVILITAFIIRFLTAVRNQAWLAVMILGNLTLVFLGLFIATFFSVPKSSGGAQMIFFEKANWNDKTFTQVTLLRNNEELQIETTLSLGSSFYALPFQFQFGLEQADTPGNLRVNKGSIGVIPLPKQVREWVWSQLSPCYTWVD